MLLERALMDVATAYNAIRLPLRLFAFSLLVILVLTILLCKLVARNVQDVGLGMAARIRSDHIAAATEQNVSET